MKKEKVFLHIEDDATDRKAIRRYLATEMPEAKILEAHDCARGLLEIENNHFDCVFLDYQLPDSDGIQFLKKLMLAEYRCPPILFLTGQGDELLAVQALKNGAADYIPKNNLSASSLGRCIKNAIRVHKLEARAREAESRLVASEEKYRNIVEKISDLVFQLDPERNITFANSAFEMLGYSSEELVGKPLVSIIASEDIDSILPQLATQGVGPMATNNLEISFKTNKESSLCEEMPCITILVDAFGMWDVSDEMVFKKGSDKNFLGTLCIGRSVASKRL